MLACCERRGRRRRADLNPAVAVLAPEPERPAVRRARFELDRIAWTSFVDRGLQVAAGLHVNHSPGRRGHPDVHAAARALRDTRRRWLWSRRAIRFRQA